VKLTKTICRQIISVKELKIEYSTFEAKKNLSNMYDVYLADEAIVGVLMPLLGKHFIRKKRLVIF